MRLKAFDSTSCNKVDSTSFSITVSPIPFASFSYNPNPPEENKFTNFVNQSVGAIKYLWDFADGDTSTDVNPSHIFPATATYKVCLNAANATGCSDDTCIDIRALIKPLVDVPSAFTPGRFGINSRIKVEGFGIAQMHWVIYNRWGQKIYETDNRKSYWDGTSNTSMLLHNWFGCVLLKMLGLICSACTMPHSTKASHTPCPFDRPRRMGARLAAAMRPWPGRQHHYPASALIAVSASAIASGGPTCSQGRRAQPKQAACRPRARTTARAGTRPPSRRRTTRASGSGAGIDEGRLAVADAAVRRPSASSRNRRASRRRSLPDGGAAAASRPWRRDRRRRRAARDWAAPRSRKRRCCRRRTARRRATAAP